MPAARLLTLLPVGGGEGWSRESGAERGGAPGGAGREECTEGWRPRGEGIEKREKSQGKERGWERGCEVGFIVGVLNQNLGLAVIAHLSLPGPLTVGWCYELAVM
jgi:hypothetical protein